MEAKSVDAVEAKKTPEDAAGTDSAAAVDRRRFLLGSLATTTASLAMVGCGKTKPGREGNEKSKENEGPASSASAAPASSKKIVWTAQASWDLGTLGYQNFERFCNSIEGLTGGRLRIEPFPNNSKAKTFEVLSAVKVGDLAAFEGSPSYWTKDIPLTAFMTSYPLGMDRPDQWETWFYELGGIDLARKAYRAQDLYFVGPVQHDINIIHSKVPIRSLEDFKKKKLRMPGGLIGDVFSAAGAEVVTFPGGKVYGALKDGQIDAADFVGPAVNEALGFGEICKYVIMGPASTPSLHQPVDLYEFTTNLKRWEELTPEVQQVVTAAVSQFSWRNYATFQRENIKAWKKLREKGVEVIRIPEADVAKLRKIAIPIWFKWAKKDPLTLEAFRSQLDYMLSDNIGFLTEAMLVDEKGKKLVL